MKFLSLAGCSFLHELLFNRLDELGMPFQPFLVQHGRSGNMRVFARKSIR